MNEPNWILSAILGAALGYLLPGLATVLLFLYRRTFHRVEIEGVWHEAHFTYEDGIERLSRETWKIKRGFRRPIILRMHPTGHAKRLYIGHIVMERDHMLVRYAARFHQETVVARFHFPATPLGQVLSGIWMSFDHDGKVTAGVSVLTERELTEREAREAIRLASTSRGPQRVLQITGRQPGKARLQITVAEEAQRIGEESLSPSILQLPLSPDDPRLPPRT